MIGCICFTASDKKLELNGNYFELLIFFFFFFFCPKYRFLFLFFLLAFDRKRQTSGILKVAKLFAYWKLRAQDVFR